jgi:hypothetical protein
VAAGISQKLFTIAKVPVYIPGGEEQRVVGANEFEQHGIWYHRKRQFLLAPMNGYFCR